MNYNFSFRTDRYNFWPIYQALKTYYPLGIERREGGIYFKYPGIAELGKLVVENIHEKENYQSRWRDLTSKWSTELDHKIISTTYGQEPSFSAYVELQNEETSERIFEKRIHFAVSLIGPFYTLFATDLTTLIEPDPDIPVASQKYGRRYQQTHRSIISPYKEYSDLFVRLRSLIENDFENHKFVPYTMHSAVLNGLQVRYRDDRLNRVYHGLFNQHFDFSSTVVGDKYQYGFDQWLIENPNLSNDWTVNPLRK